MYQGKILDVAGRQVLTTEVTYDDLVILYEQYIEKYGENLYNLTAGGNIIASDAEIEQGALETSNVNVVNEMVNMITIQRAYEAGQKVITSIDETLDKAVNNVGRV